MIANHMNNNYNITVMDDSLIEKKFDEIYVSKINPRLTSLEQERIKVKASGKPFIIVFLVSFIGAFVAASLEQIAFWGICFIICFVSIVITNMIDKDRTGNFYKKLKSQILTAILSIFGDFKFIQNG